MRKTVLLALLVLTLGVAGAASAAPGHTVTETQHQHGTWTETGDTNPCTGDSIDVTFTGNSVEHSTFFPGGDEFWGTFTEEGSISFVDSGVKFSGRATAWGNFNQNKKNQNTTFTLSIRARGSDGSAVIGHETSHLAFNANGVATVSFDKLSFTCG